MLLVRNVCRSSWLYLLSLPFAAAAYAEGGPVAAVDAGALGQKIVDLVKTVGMPIGGGILFLAVCLIAIKMMLGALNPDKKANAMEGLLYVGLGGVILGGAMFIAGAILGIGGKLQ